LKAPSPDHSRDRILSEDELKRVWRATETIGWPFGPLVRLLLLTGQRRGEVASMRWSDIDLDQKVWLIPKERSKNGQPHEVPLSDMVLGILRELPRVAGSGGFVFSTTGKTPVGGFSRAKARIEKAVGLAEPERPPL